MASKGRASAPGKRLDCPHPTSYGCFAGAALEMWSEFTIKVALMEHIAWAQDRPAFRVAQKYLRFQLSLLTQESLYEMAQVSPDLSSADLDASVALQAYNKLAIAKLRYAGLVANRQLRFSNRTLPFIARRSTMQMLVGAMWLNSPRDLPTSTSVNAIADILAEGVKREDLKFELEHKVRRARDGFLRKVAYDTNPHALTIAGGLTQGLALIAHSEQAIRVLWSSPEAKRQIKKFSNCAQAVYAMVSSQSFFEPMWDQFTVAHVDFNKGAIDEIQKAAVKGFVPHVA